MEKMPVPVFYWNWHFLMICFFAANGESYGKAATTMDFFSKNHPKQDNMAVKVPENLHRFALPLYGQRKKKQFYPQPCFLQAGKEGESCSAEGDCCRFWRKLSA